MEDMLSALWLNFNGHFFCFRYRITEGVNLPFRVLPTIKELGRTRMEINVKVSDSCLHRWGHNHIY
jgi:hypothetical protein